MKHPLALLGINHLLTTRLGCYSIRARIAGYRTWSRAVATQV